MTEPKKSLLLRIGADRARHLAIISRSTRIPQSALLREAVDDLLAKYAAKGRELEASALPEATPPRR